MKLDGLEDILDGDISKLEALIDGDVRPKPKEELVFDSKQKEREYKEEHDPEYARRMEEKRESINERRKKMKRKLRTLTESEIKDLTFENKYVVVNDFGDDFHLSDEERRERSMYYDAFMLLRKRKRKYHKLPEFIETYRLAMNCLNMVAENNAIYPVDKFIAMVLRGKIKVFGLIFPKYIGKKKKSFNWEYISQIILDDSVDPHTLFGDNETDEDDEEPTIEEMFSEEDLKRINDAIKSGDMYMLPEKPFTTDDDDIIDKKELALLEEACPTYQKIVKKFVRDVNRASLYDRFYSGYNNDFDLISLIEKEQELEEVMPEFKGSALNSDDVNRYIHQLEEYDLYNVPVQYRDRLQTKANIKEIELKSTLDKNGWNVRKLYNYKREEKELKKARLNNEKKIEKMKKRLTELSKKSSFGNQEELVFNSDNKKKKKKKKGKKKKSG